MKIKNVVSTLIECDLCGCKTENETTADKDGWDWFTGYLQSTFHCCNRCLSVNALAIKNKLNHSRINAKEGT